MVFIWSSLDDSADRKQKHVFVVGGFVSRQDCWTEIERQWQARLGAENPPLDYFKSAECKSRSKQFKRFRNLNEYTREEGIVAAQKIRDDLKQILMRSRVVGFAHGILMPDYRKVRKSGNARHLFPSNPYLAAYQQMFIRVAQKAELIKNPVAFLCDSHDLSRKMHDTYDDFKEKKNPRLGKWMGSLTYLSDKESPAVQAADLFVSICKDVFLEEIQKVPSRPLFEQFKNDWKNEISVTFWNENIMKKIVAANCPRNRKPSIYDRKQLAFFDVNEAFLARNKD